MSRNQIPLAVGDVSAFAKSLGRQLDDLGRAPGHVELLNMLARSGGFRNFQHFKAQQEARLKLDEPRKAAEPVDYAKVRRMLRYFGEDGGLIRWPKKFSHQGLCLWVLWSRIPARASFTEREISALLGEMHGFGDHALLRRELFDRGMVDRSPDGREYRRIERKPPDEAVVLLSALAGRDFGPNNG